MTDPFAELNAALQPHYIIDRELGRGGMALVYLARDTRHERFVALKTLRPEIAIALGRERFLREIKLAARLQHPNILPVYDSGDASGTLYYVMPYVEGESLRDRLDREPQLPVDDALQIAREVAEALAYAHEHDVVHRDIKPENIMMSGGHAIVADFGIARAVSVAGGDKLTQTGLAIGTPAYMPPEQASGSGQVDRRSDIYSLACVLYETLAGQPPFTGPTAQAIMARHSLDAVPRLKIVRDAIPDDLEVVIERALEKVPADRYQTSGEFAKALAAASTGAVSRVTAARRPTRAQLMWRRRMNVGIGVGAIVLVVGGWLLFGRHRNSGAGAGAAGLAQHRVAVLYFNDQSRDSSLRYLADGLTESLIDQLSAIRALDVVSRNGVAPFRGRDVPRDSIARALQAGTLVEGEVEPVGTRGETRVTIRLVEGASGVDLRRQSFELPIGAPLAMRDSLASQAALFLRERLGDEVRLREQRASTTNVEAWTLVQQAQKTEKDAAASALTDAGAAASLYARADSLLAQAEQTDPRWVEPIVQRARVAYLRARLERVPREQDKWVSVGLAHIERALRAAHQDPDALETRGTLRFWRFSKGLEPDAAAAETLLQGAKTDLETATRINPQQVGAWTVLSILDYAQRDVAEANQAARNAYEADAFLSSADAVLYRLFVTSYDLELFTPAWDWCQKGRRRFPSNPLFAQCELMLLSTNALEVDVNRAWNLANEAVRLSPERARPFQQLYQQIWVAAVLTRAGQVDSARHVLGRSRGTADVDPQKELLGYQAFVFVMLGDHSEAVRVLDEYFTANPRHREGFRKNVHWWWRPIQNDPRFKALIGAR